MQRSASHTGPPSGAAEAYLATTARLSPSTVSEVEVGTVRTRQALVGELFRSAAEGIGGGLVVRASASFDASRLLVATTASEASWTIVVVDGRVASAGAAVLPTSGGVEPAVVLVDHADALSAIVLDSLAQQTRAASCERRAFVFVVRCHVDEDVHGGAVPDALRWLPVLDGAELVPHDIDLAAG